MKRRTRRYAVRGALSLLIALGSSFAAAAGDTESAESTKPAAAASDAEFDGECVMGLALGKDIKTDCSVSTVYGGRTYCFGNETAKQLFLKKPDEFLLQAHVYYSSKQPAPGDSSNQSKPGE
jgi:YHS domain-containing protein